MTNYTILLIMYATKTQANKDAKAHNNRAFLIEKRSRLPECFSLRITTLIHHSAHVNITPSHLPFTTSEATGYLLAVAGHLFWAAFHTKVS